jgi:sulfur carrier protein ThiS
MELFVDGMRKSLRHSGDISALLKKLRVRREEVVVKLNGRLAPETSEVRAGDKVEVIKVVFGG